MISNNLIRVDNDLEGSAFSFSRRRMKPESHSLPSTSMDFELEITSLIKDFET